MSAQQAEFQERLARIRSGAGFTKATVYVGLDEAFTYCPQNQRAANGLREKLANAGFVLSFPFCLAVGFACHVLERLAEYTFAGMPDPQANIDVEMVKIAVTGFAMTVVATFLLGLRDRGLMLPKLLGVAAGMLFFHNLVHYFPDFFGQVFSPIWVAHITSVTEPNSMIWRGISFSF